MKKAGLIGTGVVIVIFLIYYAYTQFTYSKGYRDGTLIKFSEKGNIFKTYEGELNQIGLQHDNNTGQLMNNLWDFSVRDAAVAGKLSQAGGQVLRLHYREIKHAFVWQGETNYIVDSVFEVKEAK